MQLRRKLCACSVRQLAQGTDIGRGENRQHFTNLVRVTFPPRQLLKQIDYRVRETLSYDPGRIAGDNAKRRHITTDHGPRTNNGAVPDRDPGQNHRLVADPDIMTNQRILPVENSSA
ncbi:hypothetical protein GCM10011517_33380 [Actibacterium pelagium]|uniref:Uncharacterized protein n=1 Tax=Actibacterium pelagium TaxID=2029103 RepID=A0A917AQM5_9RHOB|nr:hypothetical protein GCM10011517_33380 [Actibacterium pelagium]